MTDKPNLLQSTQPKRRSLLKGLVVLLAIVLMSAGVVLYGGVALDWARASQFTPTPQLASAEHRIKLTERGKNIFYATSPQVEDKKQFNQSCGSTERTIAILGCYYMDKIYIYNVQNPELDGTLEVTAAHEMLHAAYSRLNFFDRQRIDGMLTKQYELIKNQPQISQAMKYYKIAEPGAELDELHSIIGTTVADLPQDLENYYATYFTNRSAVVALNTKYNSVFSTLSQQADALQKRIDTVGPGIESDMNVYVSDLTQLNLDIESFNARAKSGGFSTQGEFNTVRAQIENRIQQMNARQEALNARVRQYNADIEKLNSLAVHVNQLNESINGVSAPSGVN